MKSSRNVFKKIIFIAALHLFFQPAYSNTHHNDSKTIPAYLVDISSEQLPPDLSCFIADIKFDGQNIKILEFGEITKSYFKGHDNLYGKGHIWSELWNNLAQYNIPMWYVGKKLDSSSKKEIVAYKPYLDLGGRIFETPEFLKHSRDFKRCKKRKFNDDEKKMRNHKGIVVFRHYRMPRYLKNKFRREHPGFIIFNDACANWVGNKYKTSQLFDDEQLCSFKPQWKRYRKQYSPELTQQIIDDFDCNTFVIKPVSSANGWGILIVNKQDLDDTLKLIFSPKNKETIRKKQDKSYSHWSRDKSKHFLVESYETSKSIKENNQEYDATMRMVFLLSHDQGVIGTTFLGGYWKLPLLGLNEQGSLTEKHKSKINNGRISSAKISP